MSVEERLIETLASRAEGPVDTAALLAGSRSRGRARQRRRTATVALAAAAVLGAGAAIPLALRTGSGEHTGQTGQQPGSSGQPSASVPPGPTVPLPPAVTGQQTVLQNPAVLGSDPTLLHLSVDALAPRPADAPSNGALGDDTPSTGWASQAGSEYLSLQHPISVDFRAGASAAEQISGMTMTRELTIGGRPAKLYTMTNGPTHVTWVILWEPVPGVPVAARGINGTTEATLISSAESLRLDRVSRCVVRFAVAAAPAGTQLSVCDTQIEPTGATAGGRLVYKKADGSILDIRDQGDSTVGGAPNTTVAGHPARWQTGNAQGIAGDILTVTIPGGHNLFVLITGSLTRHEAEQVVAGVTWP